MVAFGTAMRIAHGLGMNYKSAQDLAGGSVEDDVVHARADHDETTHHIHAGPQRPARQVD